MRDKDIDERVAIEVMGWHKLSFSDAWISGATVRECLIEDWNPSESIEKSWLVVEKMRVKGFEIMMDIYTYTNEKENRVQISKGKMNFTERASNMPLAICNAARKAINDRMV